MTDDPTSVPDESDGVAITRRRLLAVGAVGLGATMLPSAATATSGSSRRGRLLLRGGIVLTLDDKLGDFVRADVLVDDGRIRTVAPRLHASGATVVDCTGMIVTPGFVDTHRHMWQALFRNSGPDTVLLDYVEQVLQGPNLNMTPEEAYLGDLIAALSALNAGVTTILDWSHINRTPEHSDAVIQGLKDSGIRAVYGYGPVFYHQNPSKDPYPKDIFRLRRQYFSSEDQLLTLAMATRGSFGSVPQAVTEWRTAREVGARITTHIGVGHGGGGYLQQIANALAADGQRGLGDDTTYVHACTLTDRELDAIADTGGTLSLAVPIEMQMGHGMPPIQRALDRGIGLSLSVDVETNNPTDMFTQMRAAFQLQRGLMNEEHLFRYPDPDLDQHRERLLTARDVLKMATIGGAEANGLGSKIGTLTPGKRADLLLLDAKRINVAPLSNATGAVVLGMDTSNVDSVMVDGRFVKRKGQLVGVNLGRLQRQAQDLHDVVMRRNGFPTIST